MRLPEATCTNHKFLCQGGDLHAALHVGEKRLEWRFGGCRLAAQIALGLSKLHERRVGEYNHLPVSFY